MKQVYTLKERYDIIKEEFELLENDIKISNVFILIIILEY